MRNESKNKSEFEEKIGAVALGLIVGGAIVLCLTPILEVVSPLLFSVALSALMADMIALTTIGVLYGNNDEESESLRPAKKIRMWRRVGTTFEKITEYRLRMPDISISREEKPKKQVKKEKKPIELNRPINRSISGENGGRGFFRIW